MPDVVKREFTAEGHTRAFLDGSQRTVVVLPSAVIGEGQYLPGWRWSVHVGAQTGKPSEAHIGLVRSGQLVVRGADGVEVSVTPGETFEAAPGHDAWVAGKQICVALDFAPRWQPL